MNAISAALREAEITHVIEEVAPLGEFVRVAPASAKQAIRVLKNDCGMDYYIDVFGIDTGAEVDVVVHLRSLADNVDLILKSAVDYDGVWESIWEDFPAALMPERELAEMFGLKLSGHPNPKRLLTTDELVAPMRKSAQLRTVEEVRKR